MIKHIIFDYGNVLARFDKAYIVSPWVVSAAEGKTLTDALFFDWELLDEGARTEAEYICEVKKRLPPQLYPKAEEIMAKWYLRLPPIRETRALTAQLKEKGYRIYLLSNIPLSFVGYFKTTEFYATLSGAMFSSEEKLLKPDPALFFRFLDKFRLNAEECLFVDDTAANVAGARAAGIDGFLFDRTDPKRAVETLRKRLF